MLSGIRLSVVTRRYSAIIWLAIYVALQLGANSISPPLRSPQAVLALALLSAAVFMGLSLAICASLTYAVQPIRSAAVLLSFGAIGLGGFMAATILSGPLRGAGPALLVLHAGRELFFILTAVGLGALVTHGIHDRNILLPAAVFAAFADYVVVNYGTVHWALTTPGKGQQVLNAMSAHLPRVHPGLPIITIGFADFLFLAVFFACVHRFHLRLKATFGAFFVLLTLSLWVVILTGVAIPALAPMALGFVAANFRCFKLSREELQAMAAAAAIVLIAALVLFLRRPHASHRGPASGKPPGRTNEGVHRTSIDPGARPVFIRKTEYE